MLSSSRTLRLISTRQGLSEGALSGSFHFVACKSEGSGRGSKFVVLVSTDTGKFEHIPTKHPCWADKMAKWGAAYRDRTAAVRGATRDIVKKIEHISIDSTYAVGYIRPH